MLGATGTEVASSKPRVDFGEEEMLLGFLRVDEHADDRLVAEFE
jgi:hypothetical protein